MGGGNEESKGRFLFCPFFCRWERLKDAHMLKGGDKGDGEMMNEKCPRGAGVWAPEGGVAGFSLGGRMHRPKHLWET